MPVGSSWDCTRKQGVDELRKPWMILVAITLFCLAAHPVNAGNVTQLAGFTVIFQGVDYNSINNTSTWRYHIAGDLNHIGPLYHDLSNWRLGLCDNPRQIILSASHDYEYVHIQTGTVNAHGIKYEVPVDKEDPVGADFAFTLRGQWAVGETPVWVKTSNSTVQGMIDGPSCNQSCLVRCNVVTSRVDWRLLKPGIYASKAVVVELQGYTDVKLVFTGFTNAVYLNDPGRPELAMAYSIGNTLNEADLYWRNAAEFNGTEITIPANMIELGATVTVWAKALVTTENNSSDYESTGHVDIIPLCR